MIGPDAAGPAAGALHFHARPVAPVVRPRLLGSTSTVYADDVGALAPPEVDAVQVTAMSVYRVVVPRRQQDGSAGLATGGLQLLFQLGR